MKRRTFAALPVALALGRATGADGDTANAAPPFDAAKAWHQFGELLRLDYAYFERPGIDGPKILAHFEPLARATRDRATFIALLKTVARNFADPHFNVGPGAPNDPGLVPTASDLFGEVVDGRAVIRGVRAGSDAAAQGVPVGAAVVAVDGHEPAS
ncbi:MAG TPA: hypothetical protein VFO28_07655, partial [Burkholderiaceae bacterium]|nr:hypothetical protein [Burkholderiaceae bacterium]